MGDPLKIAFCGDSFCADYLLRSSADFGWPHYLSQSLQAQVICFGIAGACEYRILKQIEKTISAGPDFILVCHTSPFRIFAPHHPLRNKDPLHHLTDFVPADTFENKDYYKKDSYVKAAREYYKFLFEETHALDIHRLLCSKILDLCRSTKSLTIHSSGFDYNGIFEFQDFISLTGFAKDYSGDINHFNEKGNRLVASIFEERIRASVN